LKTEFAPALFAGLMRSTLFSECVYRTPGLIFGNQYHVKKVVLSFGTT
jgi:lipopolysaccharide transport system permease protein